MTSSSRIGTYIDMQLTQENADSLALSSTDDLRSAPACISLSAYVRLERQ